MGKARIKCERIDQKMNKEMTSKFFEALTDLEKENNIGSDILIEKIKSGIEKAIKNGVKFAFGTDAGTPFNKFEEAPYELQLLVQNGATNFQALQAAGKLSSELLGIDADYGTLELGKFADFLVLDDNPLIDVKAVQQNNKQVYKKGHRMF